MASPEPRREPEREWNDETQPEQGGVFIRYATINDIYEIKSRLDRQDGKIDVLVVEVAEVKTGQSGLEFRLVGLDARLGGIEARQDGMEARMGRLEDKVDRLEDKLDRLSDKLDKLNAYAFRILIAIIVGLILLLAREFFF